MREKEHEMFFGSWYNLQDGSGVYAIVNSLNNKKYIGSTGALRKRFRLHYASLTRNCHHNRYLQNAVNKYGIDKFYFIVIERCENIVDTLLLIELKYIEELGDYNICTEAGKLTGTNPKGHELSEKQRNNIIKANKSRIWTEDMRRKHSESLKNSVATFHLKKRIDKYSLSGDFICTYNSISDAAKSIDLLNYNIIRVGIKRCFQGKLKSAYNFIWKLNKNHHNDK